MNEEDKLKLWWKYFEFHADQRLRAFYYYMIIIGALSVAYYICINDCHLIGMAPLLCWLAIIISIGFFFMEIRNVQLVNTGRLMLQEAMPEIEGDEEEALNKTWGILHKLRFLPDKCKCLNWIKEGSFLLSPLMKHQLWLRTIYIFVAIASFMLLRSNTKYFLFGLFVAWAFSYLSTVRKEST